MRTCLLALLMMVSLAMPDAQASTQQRLSAKALIVTQAVNGIGGPSSQVTAYTGPIAYSPTAGSLDQQGNTRTPIANTTTVPTLTVRDYGMGVYTQDQILALAAPYISGQSGYFTQSLAAYLSGIHADRGYFTFDQEVRPVNTDHSMRLVWSVSVDQSGTTTFGDPKIVDANPKIVYLVYTPKAVQSGLPASWAYPNAGLLQYQIRRPDGTALSSWASVDTGGAFDQPQGNGVALDPDAGVKCLIDRSSGSCPWWLPDAKSLITSNGAMYAIIDYVRMVQPVYTTQENPPGSGQYVQVPVMSVSVDSRPFRHSYCPLSYTNNGHYGYTLLAQTDRYYEPATGNYTQLASYQGTTLSPTQWYGYTRTDLDAYQQSIVASLIIDPTNPNGGFLTAADIPNLVYLAPIAEDVCTPPPPQYAYCYVNSSNTSDYYSGYSNLSLYKYIVGTSPPSGLLYKYAYYSYSVGGESGNLMEFFQSGYYDDGSGQMIRNTQTRSLYNQRENEILGGYARCP